MSKKFKFLVLAALTASLTLGSSFAMASCTPGDLNCGLVGHWSFDEGSGNVALDASGNGNNLYIYNPGWGAGKIGDALLFDGQSTTAQLPNTASLQNLGDFTFSAWVNLDNSVTEVILGTLVGNNYFSVGPTGNNNFFIAMPQPATYLSVPGSVNRSSSKSSWFLFTIVRSGSTVTSYVNGVAFGSLTSDPTVNPMNFAGSRLGLNGWSGSWVQWFHGAMDDVRVYNRALGDGSGLSTNEVQQLYCLGGSCGLLNFIPALTPSPTIYAGDAQTITQDVVTSTNLTGIGYVIGLLNAVLNPSWRQVSGPGTVTFASPNSFNTKATFSSAGTYVLRLTVGYLGVTSTSDTTIVVNPNITPPVISYDNTNGTKPGFLTSGTSQLILAVTTDKNATCRYSTTAGTAYGDMTSAFTVTGGTSHSITMSNLMDNNTYGYFIRCEDSFGNDTAADYPVFFSVLSPLNGKVIPDDRVVDWTKAGIPGGIPNLPLSKAQTMPDGTVMPAGKVITVTGAKGDGTSDDTAVIQAALDSTNPAGGDVVYLPKGSYYLAAPLNINHSMVLRGAGPGLTTIITNNWTPIRIGPYSAGEPNGECEVDLTGGYTKGSQTMTLKDNHCNLQVGQTIILDEQDDPSIVNVHGIGTCGVDGNSCGRNGLGFDSTGIPSPRALAQMVIVTAVHTDGTNYSIDVDTPLHYTYKPGTSTQDPAGLNPQAFTWGNGAGNNLKYVGIENLSLNANYDQWAFYFGFCDFPWVKNVEAYNLGRTAVYFAGSYKGEVVNSFFHGTAASTSGPEHYSIELTTAFENLIQNNTFYDAGADFVTGGSNGGNVISYNYTYFDGGDWQGGSMEPHSTHSFGNLFEGNVIPSIILDFIWGSGSHTTIFRNSISGKAPYTTNNRFPIILDAWQRFTNIVGNVLGTDGYHKQYQLTEATPSFLSSADNAIYEIGFKAQWYDNDPTHYDYATEGTLLRHGNYDYATHSTILEPAIANTLSLPNSMYLSQKPAWFGDLAWPPVGPDLSTMSGMIPAQQRYNVVSVPASPDTTAPTVPVNVSATIKDSVVNLYWDGAWDNVAVVGYNIYRDGNRIGTVDLINQVPANTQYQDTLNDSNQHSYAVSAYDASGNESASSASVIPVAPPIPDVQLSSPIDGGSYITPTNISLQADVSTTFAATTVTKVEFYSNGSLVGTVNQAPYIYTWNNVPPGTYALTAVVTNAAGKTTTTPKTSSATITVANPADIKTGLVAYYPLDDLSGVDASGNGNNLIGINGASLTSGKVGSGAVHMNGGALQLPNTSSLSNLADFTFSGWYTVDNNVIGNDFWGTTDNTRRFTIGNTGNYNFTIDVGQGGAYEAVPLSKTPGPLPWFLFTVVRSGSTITTYVNGVQAGASFTADPAAYPLNFAGSRLGNTNGYDYPLHGNIDDVRIYNRALSTTDIAALARGQAATLGTGDLSGDTRVTLFDASLLLRYTMGSTLTTLQQTNADLDGDGQLTPTDKTLMVKKALGL